jgi:hypothetical protein
MPAFRVRAFAVFPSRRRTPPHLTWCAAWRRAQVPLADNNARKLVHARSSWARKPAAGLPKRP